MWLSDAVHHSIEAAIAKCTTVADIDEMRRDLLDHHPELRFNLDDLVEILVSRATAKGLAVRFDGSSPDD